MDQSVELHGGGDSTYKISLHVSVYHHQESPKAVLCKFLNLAHSCFTCAVLFFIFVFCILFLHNSKKKKNNCDTDRLNC